MGERNLWVDEVVRDRGTYRIRPVKDLGDDPHCDYALKSTCNDPNEYEDALIEALDAGMDSDEIADILLGSIS